MLMEGVAVIGGLALLIPAVDVYYKSKENRLASHYELNSVKGDGIRISKNVCLSHRYANEHVRLIAPSGAGKSYSFIIPNVKRLKGCTRIITDPSGEIARDCAKDEKYPIVFNPFSDNTVGYDPLYNCKNEFEVKKLASIILINGSKSTEMLNGSRGGGGNGNQAEWISMGTPLFCSYLLFNYYTKKYTFDVLIRNLLTKPIMPRERDGKMVRCNSIFEEIMDSNVESAKIEFQSFLRVMSSPATLGSILTILNSNLQIFTDENIKRISRKQPIDFSILREKPYALFIQIPERHSIYYSPLFSVFVQQMVDRLMDNPDGLQTYMMLDEWANIGYLPNLNQTLATCRKTRISVCTCSQNDTQLERVYGEVEAKDLRALFKTVILMGGLKDCLEYYSNMLGTKHVERGNNIYSEPVVSIDKLRTLPDYHVLLICGNKKPVMDSF